MPAILQIKLLGEGRFASVGCTLVAAFDSRHCPPEALPQRRSRHTLPLRATGTHRSRTIARQPDLILRRLALMGLRVGGPARLAADNGAEPTVGGRRHTGHPYPLAKLNSSATRPQDPIDSCEPRRNFDPLSQPYIGSAARLEQLALDEIK